MKDAPETTEQPPDVAITAADTPEVIAEETGMIPISEKTLGSIRALGVRLENEMVTMQSGFIFFSQATLALCLEKITEALQSGDCDPLRAAQPLSQLARAMCTASNTLRPAGVGASGAPGSRKSFPAYTAIQVNVNPKVSEPDERK